jgi:hypothetical protein
MRTPVCCAACPAATASHSSKQRVYHVLRSTPRVCHDLQCVGVAAAQPLKLLRGDCGVHGLFVTAVVMAQAAVRWTFAGSRHSSQLCQAGQYTMLGLRWCRMVASRLHCQCIALRHTLWCAQSVVPTAAAAASAEAVCVHVVCPPLVTPAVVAGIAGRGRVGMPVSLYPCCMAAHQG